MKEINYGPVGPIITGVWDLRDPSKPVNEGYIVEDMGAAGAFGEVIFWPVFLTIFVC